MESSERGRRWRVVSGPILALLLFAVFLSSCNRSETPPNANKSSTAPASAGAQYQSLQRFDALKGVFDLGIAPCNADGCAIEVRWIENNKLVSYLAMPVRAANHETQKEVTDLNWGADNGLQAWATGEESAYVSTVARLVKLDKDSEGLLVSQLFGFDHLKRLHRLIVLRDSKLVVAWDFNESAGPTWSATTLLGAGTAQHIALFSSFSNYDTPNEPDRVSVTRLVWDGSAGKMVPELGGKVALALVAGRYPSPAEARKFKSADKNGCVASYRVLSSGAVNITPANQVVLAALYSLDSSEQIEQDKKQIVNCGIKLKLSVVDIVSSPMPYEMRE